VATLPHMSPDQITDPVLIGAVQYRECANEQKDA
jgi:hypothetical protein